MAADEIPGEPFGKYRVVGLLASGGMAQLYLAVHAGIEGFAKVVALKRILPHLVDHPQFIQMFLNEARLAARLDHPNIVRIYELGEISGQFFISMEYLPGEDLSRVLYSCTKLDKKMPLELVIPLVQSAAEGLHFAHGLSDAEGKPLGLVHRDVNPSNIIVTYQSSIKLVDFGIAKATSLASETKVGMLKGKLAYVSPEQIAGLDLDRRSDIFSLGIVLWELLTCKRLFHCGHEAATLDAIKKCIVVPPSVHRPEVPAELDAITLRALAPLRKDRFQTADELSDALESFATDAGIRTAPKQLGVWLEGLFGQERADAKRSIAQGRLDLAQRLRLLGRGESFQPARAMHASPSEHGTARPAQVDLGSGEATPSAGSSSVPRPEPPRSPSVPLDSLGVPRSGPQPLSNGDGASSPPQPLNAWAAERRTPAHLGEEFGRTPHDLSLKSSPSHTLPETGRRHRTVGIMATFVVVILAAGLFWLFRSGATAVTLVSPAGVLSVTSQPPGALIFLDGEPTGLFTPAVLNALPTGKPLAVMVERGGFERAQETLVIRSGESAAHEFLLRPSRGAVRFQGLPADAVLLIDGRAVSSDRVDLGIGKHDLRVEGEQGVIEQRTIEVRPGDQTIRLGRAP